MSKLEQFLLQYEQDEDADNMFFSLCYIPYYYQQGETQ